MWKPISLVSRFAVISAVIISSQSVARAESESVEPFLLPKDLVEIAINRNCFQYTNFYNVVGQIDPPYIYGVAMGPDEHSAAFWCQRGDRDFALMFMQMGQNGPEYAGEIRTRNLPSGLSIFSVDGSVTTDGLKEIQADDYSLPDDQRLNGVGIRSNYDGAGFEFVNFNGKWFRRFVH